MLEDLNQKVFEPHVHSVFTVSDGPAFRLPLELTQVTGSASDPRIESFSLLFRGPVDPLLPQKIYTFEHPEIGTFSIFIVPVGQDSAGTTYQAIFNRLKDQRSAEPPQGP